MDQGVSREAHQIATADLEAITAIKRLTAREWQVLERLSHGMSNSEIAGQLYLSVNTMKTHTRKMYRKLSVHNRTQAATRYVELST